METAAEKSDREIMNVKPVIVYTGSLEDRIRAIEEKIARFESALHGAAKMLLGNPMASAMLPKEVKNGLKEYFAELEKKS